MQSIPGTRHLFFWVRYFDAVAQSLEDTLLLTLFAAVWLITFFTVGPDQTGLAALGRVLSVVGLCAVFILWSFRPALRPGWRPRDLTLVLLAAVIIVEDLSAPIRNAAMLDLLFTLELAAMFVIALHLAMNRPQPLLAITVALLALTLAVAAFHKPLNRFMLALWPPPAPAARAGAAGAQFLASISALRLGEIAFLAALAALPWFAPQRLRPYRLRYQWLMLAAIGLVLILEATGVMRSDGNWVRRIQLAFPYETRHFILQALPNAWLIGFGPDHYEWLFAANLPSYYAGQMALVPGGVILLLERGLIGFAAFAAFAVAMLWTFRPGPWGRRHADVLEMAQPLRLAAVYVLFLYLFTPALRSGFGAMAVWILLAIVRSWSSGRPHKAVALVTNAPASEATPPLSDANAPALDAASAASGIDAPAPDVQPAARVSSGGQWTARQVFAVVGTLLLGLGLTAFHLAPWVARLYRPNALPEKRTPGPELLARLDTARLIWPYDPRTDALRGAWFRAQPNMGRNPDYVDAATQSYRRMIYLNPYDPLGYVSLALWYYVRNDFEGAADVIRNGLQYAPANLLLQFWLARLQRILGRSDQALETLERIYQMHPREIRVLRELADIYIEQFNYREAETRLRLVLQIAPENKEAREKLEAIRAK
jgi:tetratricopeptide (TPR) repeat protein